MDESVEVEVGGGGDGFVVEELRGVERDGRVEVGEERYLDFVEKGVNYRRVSSGSNVGLRKRERRLTISQRQLPSA